MQWEYALSRAESRLRGGEGGEASVCKGLFGLEGRRPRRPFRLSVRTTVDQNGRGADTLGSFASCYYKHNHDEYTKVFLILTVVRVD